MRIAVIGTGGEKRVKQVRIARLLGDGGDVLRAGETMACDLVAMSGGWNPAIHLFSQSGGKVRFDEALGTCVPGASVQAERSAGACNGAFGPGTRPAPAGKGTRASRLPFPGTCAALPSRWRPA